jgi:GAF domain-containing protein
MKHLSMSNNIAYKIFKYVIINNMLKAPSFNREDERLEATNRLGLLSKGPNPHIDALVKEAVEKIGVPISTLTVLDKSKEHYQSCVGLNETEGDRAVSFCGHALLAQDLFIVPDCKKDPRFADNPMVIGSPFIRFYAGMAIYDYMTKLPVAVFCIKDKKPRELDVKELDTFLIISRKIEEIINGISPENLSV